MVGRKKPQATSSAGPSKVSFGASSRPSRQQSTSTALPGVTTRSMAQTRPMTRSQSQSRSGSTFRDVGSFSAAARAPSVSRDVERRRSRSRSRTPAPRARAASVPAVPAHHQIPVQGKKKYRVEKILEQMQLKNGKRKFRIKWEGYDESANDWVFEQNMFCPELIKEWDEERARERRIRENNAEDAESTAASDSADEICRACNPLHKDHRTYSFKRAQLKEEETTQVVACDFCLSWYHIQCVDEEAWHMYYINTFACLDCRQHHDSTMHTVVAPHRKDFFNEAEKTAPIEVGSKSWMDTFFPKWESKQFPEMPTTHVAVCEDGNEFMDRFEKEVLLPGNGWTKIYTVKKMDGLDMKVPEKKIEINFIIDKLGKDFMVPVIDVYRQESTEMSLGTYRELASESPDNRPFLYNILSLEFTDTDLAKDIQPPQFVKEISWVQRYWPKKFQSKATRDPKHREIYPKLEYFCLMGMGGSFTDFHLDHGGSSVYYHVHTGCKIFYVIKPTTENLVKYENHQRATGEYKGKDPSTIFLGDEFPQDQVWRVVVDAGNTLMLPAGWIHAVYTPVDSLVFGGNFLTDHSIPLQCETFAHEARAAAPTYPYFRTVSCYAARTLTAKLKEHNAKSKSNEELPLTVLQGAEALIFSMERWIDMDRSAVEDDATFASVGPDEPFIHKETQRDILSNLKKEFERLQVSVPAPSVSFTILNDSGPSTSYDSGPSTSSASHAGGYGEPSRKRAKLSTGADNGGKK